MDRMKVVFVCVFLMSILLGGCQMEGLPNYSDALTLRMYGNEVLKDGERKCVETLIDGFSRCLFHVDGSGVDKEVLNVVAPKENPEKWDAVYRRNQTLSELNGFQLLDIYVESQEAVRCLCLCEARYSDWKTPEDDYLFIVRVDVTKENGQWQVTGSELMGTARKSDTIVIRDDITDAIKFTKKGGEQK